MNNKVKYCCVICKDEFTTNNLSKHYNRCIVKGGKIIWNKIPDPMSLHCVYCDKICKNKNSHTQHTRTCPRNKDRVYTNYSAGKSAWNKGKTKETNDIVRRSAEKLKDGYKSGRIIAKEITNIDRERLSRTAKERGFGGYRENAGRSKKYKVIDSFGTSTTLQSSYEYKCFEILTEMNIRWIRPKALKYDGRNYFADFYLVDHNIYLDPKNNYKAKLDAEKIRLAKEQNQVAIFVILEKDLTKDHITRIVKRL
jgi:hypothetical protein